MTDRIYISGDRPITDSITNITDNGAAYPVDPDAVSSLDLKRWFLNLFPFRVSSVIRRGEGSRWLDVSRFYCLTDEDIFEAIKPGAKSQRGFRFEEKTMFLVLSIPSGSIYHNMEAVLEIRELLKSQLGVSARHYQSDDDWFLYLFLTEEVPAQEAGKQLREWCLSQGFDIAGGAMDVHPSDKPLPFPLQNRFSWYNEKGQLLVRRSELTTDEAIGFFLQDAGQNSVDPEPLFEKMRLHAFGFANSIKEDSPEFESAAGNSSESEPVAASEISTESEAEIEKVLDFNPLKIETEHAEAEETSTETQNVVQLSTVQREPVVVPENFAVQEAQLLLFPGLVEKSNPVDNANLD